MQVDREQQELKGNPPGRKKLKQNFADGNNGHNVGNNSYLRRSKRLVHIKLNYQKIPSKMLATVKEDCINTTIRIMCVHAYWPN